MKFAASTIELLRARPEGNPAENNCASVTDLGHLSRQEFMVK